MTSWEADVTASHELAARQFMAHKGLGHIRPHAVEQLEGHSCWYFYYQLPEGELELEVFWNDHEWDINVTAFTDLEDAN